LGLFSLLPLYEAFYFNVELLGSCEEMKKTEISQFSY